ncbi:RNA 3'-terminal phosphate cyclase-like protein [Nosema bombycis CQ1]|uniref:RNA 3'-terminal phosphate cyclase-like protein n=1 Tax=Nosema bombycis (strain CQ1 / CVCC 102059) TaxID=578461 RepID=R0KTJ1_NOSB1|nr:RNA 3'-terminal phosphate cyclase-like protein [Nosema bombycis CQ1]|eukprot:EOB13547.1 RNA 3'-terminal phosphate cyclase-like protein [Nosema bombycis CQ1]
MDYLEIEDSDFFNFAISYSLLSKKSVKIKIKRSREYKEDYVKMICYLSKNSEYKYDAKTKTLFFNPGVFLGGSFVYNCKDEIYNYIGPLLLLIPFAGTDTKITFKGITNRFHCVEIIKIANFSLLKHFEIQKLDLVVKKTGFFPDGEGEVELNCGPINQIKNVDLTGPSELIKTRAFLISSRLNSTFISEMSEVIKDLLGDLNLKIFTHLRNGKDSGPSPGYQCALFMESIDGIFYIEKDGFDRKPRDVAKDACLGLLNSANKSGLFDEKMYPLLFSFLAISSTDISSVKISRKTDELEIILKYLKIFFNYSCDTTKYNDHLIIKSSGCGYKNINMKLN